MFALMKRSLGAEEWIRRGLGVAVLVGVVAIALGWDTGILRRVSLASTARARAASSRSFPATSRTRAVARRALMPPAERTQIQLG